MIKTSYAAEQAKIAKQIDRLKKKAEQLRSKHRKPIIASIVRAMRENSLTPDDIANALGSRRARPAPAARKASVKRAVAAKYRHPQTGETWSGRGKAPRWLSTAEAAGASRESFLI